MSDFVRGGFVCGGGDGDMVTISMVKAVGISGGGQVEGLGGGEKVRLMGGSGIIIGEILCLFLLLKLPILLALLSFSLLHG